MKNLHVLHQTVSAEYLAMMCHTH